MPNALRSASRSRLFIALIAAVFATSVLLHQMYFARRTQAASSSIVISQIYGGGGNASSIYKNDFIEIFNRGNTTINLTGWSVQYAATTGTSWQKTDLSGSLAPGRYYLVQEAAGAGGTTSLPAPDATGAIPMSATAGKVALLSTNTLIPSGTSCPAANVVDIAGFGTGTNCFEGSGPTPAPSNTNAVFRDDAGCGDTDNNAADFASATAPVSPAAAAPRNTSTAAHPCTAGNNPPSINTPANPIATKNQDDPPFTVSLSGSDDGGIYSWGATAGTGISSVIVSGGQGTANVTYSVTLQAGFSGTATFTASLSDTVNPPATQAVNIAVNGVVPPAPVVISQVYGGGGNTGSTWKNDFIELINHGSAPVNLNGWSVQVYSTTTSTWNVTPLTNFTLQPGEYYLIQESQGAGGTDDLPTPDAIGTITVSSTSGKVALVNNTTTLTGTCPTGSGIVDFVGYGTTDCFEGSGTAPILNNTTADLRANEGCFDTNDNANDFATGEPTPRNSSSPIHDCTSLSGYGSANPSSVPQGGSTTLTVHVAPAQNPTSSGITVTANLSSIGGSPSQSFTGGPNTFTFNAIVSPSATPGIKSLPVTITDAQTRSFGTSIVMSVLPVVPDHITISQVYGGGGNSGATYTNDYVELYNPTSSTVTVTGWSLQYGSATGTTWTNKQPIGGYIEPGQYYLVRLASGGANGAPLPVTPNISGGINMSATAGKVALVRNSDSLSGGCPLGTDPDVVDFVGYGSTANCHEGSANTPAPSNSTAIFRQGSGATDTDQNGADFTTATPNPRRTAPIVELGPWVAGTDPNTDGNTVPHDASITVDFSEPVDIVGAWYNITCVSTGSHNIATEAHTNDFKTYVITPNINFQFGEQCTVTIDKNSVHDQDTDDSGADTDTLFANYVWSFTVVGAGTPAPYPPSVHLTMGNPSNATPSLGNPNNYLMEKPTYSLSYNRDKGTPNWVSWHLDPSWYGTLARVDTFRPDPAVDPTWYRVQAFDYSLSGFDRGHMTPNADRDNQNRIPINQETYLMTNMVPQAPDNNQGPWASFEGYLRTVTDGGKEVYIISGPVGVGGTGSNGFMTSVANGHVTVPSSTWKVVLVLPQGTNDVSRVDCSTRTIAILMPNTQGIRSDPWENFVTTVDAVELATGYDFFSNLPEPIQRCVEAGTNGNNPPLDTDADGVPDTTDNCPTTPNPDQLNTDGDAQGNACDPDDDNDGVADTADNCPLTANPGQADFDHDGLGDACDPDDDNDGVADGSDLCPNTPANTQVNAAGCPDQDGDGVADTGDNCPSTANADQADFDHDGIGDACDPDDDNDGVADGSDLCPNTPPNTQVNAAGCPDQDGDGVGDTSDNCPTTANADQADFDHDGIGDACDSDDDNDGVADGSDLCPNTPPNTQVNAAGCPDQDGDGVADSSDNCPGTANADQADFDHDGIGDACDPDDDGDGVADGLDLCPNTPPNTQVNAAGCPDQDGDGVADTSDNCPGTANANQADFDHDGIGDACDPDDDNDGVADGSDLCPNTPPNTPVNAAGCPDADGDGIADTSDNCPNVANPGQADFDHDGIGDACDPDDDGDGVADGLDLCPNTPPSTQVNAAGCPDADGDGIADTSDNCPNVANPGQADFDHDGLGDACDPDDDNDGVADGADQCPNTPPNTQVNAAGCPDADGDGIANSSDNCPTTFNPDQRDTNGDGIGDACTAFQLPSGGLFVIGDQVSLSNGSTVYFWGSQWSQNNPMSGGSAPNVFKGFEDGSAPPACGDTWTTSPGNSSNPPPTVPQYMAVIVSSSVQKNGSVISGDIKKIIIVRTNPGYGPSAGQPGTGEVVAILCGTTNQSASLWYRLLDSPAPSESFAGFQWLGEGGPGNESSGFLRGALR